jgi:hypothetical protein
MINSSLKSMPKIAMFFVHRIRSDALRAALFTAFLKEYRAIFEFMCDGARQRLDDLSAGDGIAAATHLDLPA